MATLVSDVVARTGRHLFTGAREEMDTLAQPYTAAATTLTVTYGTSGIQKGASLAVDLELFFVLDVDSTNKVATVIGAQGGSTAANHSTGAVVVVNPKFSQFDIFTALNEELDALTAPVNSLYQVKSLDITYTANVWSYDMTGESAGTILGINEIRWKTPTSTKEWPRITKFELTRDMATTEFASTYALLLYETPMPSRTMHVRYGATFPHVTQLTDDIQAVAKFPAAANDILALGAAIRSVLGREIKRNFDETQGETRRASEVPAGAETAEIRNLLLKYQQRVAEEAMRLRRFYPLVTRGR